MRMKVSFEGVNPAPGDVVVIRPSVAILQHEAKELWEISKKAFPDNSVVILPPDINLINYSKEEFLKFLDNLKKLVEKEGTE